MHTELISYTRNQLKSTYYSNVLSKSGKVSLFIFKRRKIFVIAFILSALSNIILNIIFIPKYGVIAAAVTTLISYIILTVIIGYSARNYLKFDIHLKFLFKCIFASIIMTLCIWIISPINIFEIIISIAIGFIIYVCLLLLQKGRTGT